MIDPNHPGSWRRYAASRQIDLILDCSKCMTLSDPPQRQAMLEIMRPALAGLRWLNKERFGGSRKIARTIDRLERDAEALAGRRAMHPAFPARTPNRCPVCEAALMPVSEYDPIPHCGACLDQVQGLIAIQSFEDGFGVMAI